MRESVLSSSLDGRACEAIARLDTDPYEDADARESVRRLPGGLVRQAHRFNP